MLRDLVMCFDNEEGLPESVFNYACAVIIDTLGPAVRDVFGRYIDATDGGFYFKDTRSAKACWKEMCKVAGKEQS